MQTLLSLLEPCPKTLPTQDCRTEATLQDGLGRDNGKRHVLCWPCRACPCEWNAAASSSRNLQLSSEHPCAWAILGATPAPGPITAARPARASPGRSDSITKQTLFYPPPVRPFPFSSLTSRGSRSLLIPLPHHGSASHSLPQSFLTALESVVLLLHLANLTLFTL